MNLAIADILFAMFIAPSVLLRLTSFHPKGMIATGLCKFVTGGNVAWIGAISSIFSLVAIAVERYYAVMYPFSNRGNLTKRKLKVCKGKGYCKRFNKCGLIVCNRHLGEESYRRPDLDGL